MTKGKPILIQKDPQKGTAPNNYRPVTCQSMIWKILTAQFQEEIYYLIKSREQFSEEQKECCKRTRVTGYLQYTDQHIPKESKTKRKNVAWIDFKKAYDGPAKLNYRLSQNEQDIQRSHKVYRKYHGKQDSGTDSRKKKLGWGENPERNFPERCAITITICNSNDVTESRTGKCTGGCKLYKSQEKINHLMYMDDIKLFAKKEKQLETLIQAVRIHNDDIGMEFGIEKRWKAKNGKWRNE